MSQSRLCDSLSEVQHSRTALIALPQVSHDFQLCNSKIHTVAATPVIVPMIDVRHNNKSFDCPINIRLPQPNADVIEGERSESKRERSTMAETLENNREDAQMLRYPRNQEMNTAFLDHLKVVSLLYRCHPFVVCCRTEKSLEKGLRLNVVISSDSIAVSSRASSVGMIATSSVDILVCSSGLVFTACCLLPDRHTTRVRVLVRCYYQLS